MTKRCPNCKTSRGGQFCPVCGEKLVRVPTCNWCGREIWDYMTFCENCGRSRHDALETSPLPLRTRLRNWLSGLFSKKEIITEIDK